MAVKPCYCGTDQAGPMLSMQWEADVVEYQGSFGIYQVPCCSYKFWKITLRSDTHLRWYYFPVHLCWGLNDPYDVMQASQDQWQVLLLLCPTHFNTIQLAIRPQDSTRNAVWLFHRTIAPQDRAGGKEEKLLEQAGWPAELEQTALCTKTLLDTDRGEQAKEILLSTQAFAHTSPIHMWTHVCMYEP